MKVIIIEDEQLSAELLAEYLAEYDSAVQIEGVFKSKIETEQWFLANRTGEIDLVFSDIELLDGNVFSLLQKNLFNCPIIFTTAYNDFYQDAFDTNGIAYLLKPVSHKKFVAAMEKFRNIYQKDNATQLDWNRITEMLHGRKFRERITVKNSGEITILNVSEISAILSSAGKLTAVDSTGKEHEFKGKISDLVTELDPKTFFQINRGEIVNINYIEKIENYLGDRLSVKMKNYRGHLITSASTTAQFRKWID